QRRYPPDRYVFLLQLMKKFEICFRFPNQDDTYLVPELLSRDQPSLPKTKAAGRLLFEYRYQTLLPEGLIPRFIAATYTLSEQGRRWRTGVELHFEGNIALVVGDAVARRVRISVGGPTAGRRRLLAIIRQEFDRLHLSSKYAPEAVVPLPDQPDA